MLARNEPDEAALVVVVGTIKWLNDRTARETCIPTNLAFFAFDRKV